MKCGGLGNLLVKFSENHQCFLVESECFLKARLVVCCNTLIKEPYRIIPRVLALTLSGDNNTRQSQHTHEGYCEPQHSLHLHLPIN